MQQIFNYKRKASVKNIKGDAVVYFNNSPIETFSKYEDYAFTNAESLKNSINNYFSGWCIEQNYKNIPKHIREKLGIGDL